MPSANPILGLENKIALVTGAGQGIGRGTAVMLARAGCHVAVADVSPEFAAGTVKLVQAEGRKGLAVQADVRTEQGIKAMLDATVKGLGGLDICVNNVGGLVGHRPTRFLELDRKFYDDIVANNLHATFWCCNGEAKSFVARKVKGVIVNISSIAGIRANIGLTPYGSSKAAIINLTMSLALELAPHGIRVNAVAPGTVATEKYQERFKSGGFDDVAQSNPLKRLGRPEDMGGAVVYLASDLASYVTGQVLAVDGGVSVTTIRPAP
ncbi:MAG: SDR family oxidoreductase [Chloroflexi bacterium]|nr:SDR family oxidoreductase [Chloroflexota bacterium]